MQRRCIGRGVGRCRVICLRRGIVGGKVDLIDLVRRSDLHGLTGDHEFARVGRARRRDRLRRGRRDVGCHRGFCRRPDRVRRRRRRRDRRGSRDLHRQMRPKPPQRGEVAYAPVSGRRLRSIRFDRNLATMFLHAVSPGLARLLDDFQELQRVAHWLAGRRLCICVRERRKARVACGGGNNAKRSIGPSMTEHAVTNTWRGFRPDRRDLTVTQLRIFWRKARTKIGPV